MESDENIIKLLKSIVENTSMTASRLEDLENKMSEIQELFHSVIMNLISIESKTTDDGGYNIQDICHKLDAIESKTTDNGAYNIQDIWEKLVEIDSTLCEKSHEIQMTIIEKT